MSLRARRWFVVFILVPLALSGLAYLITTAPYTKYVRGLYEFLAFLLIVDLAFGLRGAWRNLATMIAATVFGLAVIELGSAAVEADQPIYPRGFSISRPVLGWGPAAPGVYHSTRREPDGRIIYNVDYTIDSNLLRATQSRSTGPSVAFFGDSMTFGQGLPDSETLPQIYADLTGHKVRVLNFGFPGYGPQQFLRALETGFFDPLLPGTKVFVYETASWHAERSGCRAAFVARAPRYELQGGVPVFVGACAEGARRVFGDIFTNGALYQRFIGPLFSAVTSDDVEIYLAELVRSAALVKQKYGARLVVLYLHGPQAFLNSADSVTYLAKSGFTDAMIEARLRKSGIELIDAT